MESAEKIFFNGKITGFDPKINNATAIAVANGRILKVGSDKDVMATKDTETEVIDLKQARVIPGLIDSHLHLIRGGLNYNLELRWDGVDSLAVALHMLKEQVQRTPAPQWVRVVGGFCEHQFREKRLPTLAELNQIAPDTPVFILHLYDRALLNKAALKACGYNKNTPNPPGGVIDKDKNGQPTGLLLANPNAMILYSTLAQGPKLPFEYQLNSTRHFMRELNRLGVTSVIDAGGGFQNYPDDYQVVDQLAKNNELTLRIAYNLFTQNPKAELSDFQHWTQTVKLGQGSDFYRHNGAGEMLVFSAADFEDFREPRPNLPTSMEHELEKVVHLLVASKWPFRLHATYNESIERALTVFEKVNREIPFNNLHWFFDHAETITEKNIERVKALGGGIAIQHRMAYQGEYFAERYGKQAAEHSPPIHAMLKAGIPVGAGTDATRVASYNPWISLYWLTTGKTVGGMKLYPQKNLLSREQALKLWTTANTWFSNESGLKGEIKENFLADFAVLSADYFSVADEDIKNITSVLTVLGGKIVHGSDSFFYLSPKLPDPMPDWSPVRYFEGFQSKPFQNASFNPCCLKQSHSWDFGCLCWAV